METSEHIIYLGCYTHQNIESENPPAKGIYRLRVSGEGKLLEEPALMAECPSPSYFYLTRTGRQILYAASEPGEGERGALSAYYVGPEGHLSFFSRQTAAGAGLCHITADPPEKNLLVCSYPDATVQSYPIHQDGSIEAMFALRRHVGKGPNAERQEAAHAHEAVFSPSGKYLFICDLGMDEIVAYTCLPETGKMHREQRLNFHAPEGCGPRHLLFSPDGRYAYLVCELSSEVLVLSYSDEEGFSLKETVSTLSPAFSSARNYPSALRITQDGKHLYVSNRGEDTIAHFLIHPETGHLSGAESASTLGWYPRDFILTKDEKLLIAANQLSDNLVIFSRDKESGRLTVMEEAPMPQKPIALLEL